MIGFALPRDLPRARLLYSCADNAAGIAQAFGLQLTLAQASHRHMHIDSIEQWPRDLIAVAFYLIRGAAAAVGIAAMVATGARIHRGDQLEASRKAGLVARARNPHLATFEWLTQYFQYFPWKFGQFIEEEYSRMRERNLPRLGIAATTDVSSITR